LLLLVITAITLVALVIGVNYIAICFTISTIVCSSKVKRLTTDPDELCCSISQARFVSPVVAADGNTYEKNFILRWQQIMYTLVFGSFPTLINGERDKRHFEGKKDACLGVSWRLGVHKTLYI